MRVPIVVRLLIAFCLVLVVALLPVYLYLGRDAAVHPEALTFLVRAGGVAASLALLLGLGATVSIVRPLEALRQAAQAYARGEYTLPLPKPRRDEIGDLVQALS